MRSGRANWGGNLEYSASALVEPTSEDEVADLIRSSPRVKVLASRHSFNDLADTSGIQISLDRLPFEVELDERHQQITVPGWATYGEVAHLLVGTDLALHTMASLPHISVAGAIATATHGSGARVRGLASAVHSMDIIDGLGQPVRVRRGVRDFVGHVVHLGALGVVTAVTLDLVPARTWHQRSYVGLSGDDLTDDPLGILGVAENISVFTRWQDRHVEQVLLKSGSDPDDDPGDIAGAKPVEETLHPVPGMDPVGVTQQGGVPGAWSERLPHFLADFQPSTGREIQSEWFVPIQVASQAIEALWRVGPELDDVLQTSEIRAMAADDLWLSPACGQDVVCLHFTWHLDPLAVNQAVAAVEHALAPFDALPHWGKIWSRSSGSHRRYPRLADFRDLVARRDPEGRFRNALVDDLLRYF